MHDSASCLCTKKTRTSTSPEQMNHVLPGDDVEIEIFSDAKGKEYGEVLKLLSSELSVFVAELKTKTRSVLQNPIFPTLIGGCISCRTEPVTAKKGISSSANWLSTPSSQANRPWKCSSAWVRPTNRN